MASNTENLNLYKKDPATDGEDTFNIETMLNENWDRIDRAMGKIFDLRKMKYDSDNDQIELTFSPGIAELFNSNSRVLVEKSEESTYKIDGPSANTTYYIFIQKDGSFTHNTSGDISEGSVLLWKVETGDNVDNLTAIDRRAKISEAALKLASHLADYANPHQVKAEQVFALGGVPAGTTFPTSPAPYTLFFRTDLNKLFVYLP